MEVIVEHIPSQPVTGFPVALVGVHDCEMMYCSPPAIPLASSYTSA